MARHDVITGLLGIGFNVTLIAAGFSLALFVG